MPNPKPRQSIKFPRLHHDRRVLLLALLAGLPAILCAEVLLWLGDYSNKVQWTLTLLMIGVWLACAFSLRERVVRPLQTTANLLAALHEEDFSTRARGATHNDPLGELLMEVNSLSQTLRQQKLSAIEAAALLRTVMAEIEVAIFAFDHEEKLMLINRAGERLLSQPKERLLKRTAADIGLAECLKIKTSRTMNLSFPGAGPGGVGRWQVKHGGFRSQGLPHHLLALSDLSQTLRDEERKAWQRLVRVLGHELNNSLTPIKSIAGSLLSLLGRTPRPADWEADAERGLSLIAERAEALNRFLSSYSKLARLPLPEMKPLQLGPLLERVTKLETRCPVFLDSGTDITIQADADQLEQSLINLLHNAAEANLDAEGGVVRLWWKKSDYLEIVVEDQGHGIASDANLFVPFFTTKPGGSGIGLVLSRQIAEAHGGSLTLENKADGGGCLARLRLPL